MITLSDVTLMRGGHTLLGKASATFFVGDKVGLVGKNGCGKSSLFALLKGELPLDGGTCNVPKDWRISWVEQEVSLVNRVALEYVIDGDSQYRALEQKIAQSESDNSSDKIAEYYEEMLQIDGYSIQARAAALLDGLGFTQDQMSWQVKQFSGGWRMRLNLARALLCPSDLLLLDEPTNHLDLDAVFWLEKWLQSYRGTLLLISHDRDFLDPVVKNIVHIENKELKVYSGNYSAFEVMRAEHLKLQQARFVKQQQHIEHLQSYIARFRYKATKARQAQSRIKALERMEHVLPAQYDNPFSFRFRPSDALPTPLLKITKADVGYDDKVILKEVKLELLPSSRIGLLGKNGAGKSTLIKLLGSALTPLSGEFLRAQGLSIGYFSQHQLDSLYDDDSPLQHLRRLSPNTSEQQLRDYLGSFGFSGEKALASIAPFSGGEKARLALALLVWQRPNVLLLDEPTNHLDLDMRSALILALQEYEGAMVIVSHDRHLLRATVDDFYLVDDAKLTPFEGDLHDYHKWLTSRKPPPSTAKAKEPKVAKAVAPRRDLAREKKIASLERQITKYSNQLTELDTALADNALYQSENQDKLHSMQAQQTTLQAKVNQLEEEWLQLQADS